MGTETKTKINRLINHWTAGTVGATSYLNTSGFSRDLLFKYKNSGWLESFGHGAYIRAGDKAACEHLLDSGGLPCYDLPEQAVRVFACMRQYARIRQRI